MDEPLPATPREIEDAAHVTRFVARLESTSARWRQQLATFARDKGLVIEPLVEDAAYAPLAAKHRELREHATAIEHQHRDTSLAIARGLVAHRSDTVERQAQALVDGRPADVFVGFEELRARQVRLQSDAEVYGEATRIVRAEMEEIRAERSIDAAETAMPLHREAARRVAAACAALSDALTEEMMVREIVTAAGYDDRLRSFSGFAPLLTGWTPGSSVSVLGELGRTAREYAG